MDEASFEWDDAKAASNAAKHGVTFETARRAFLDTFALEGTDPTIGETRFTLLGMVDRRVLFIAFTLRGLTTRLISARQATSSERRRYHDEDQA